MTVRVFGWVGRTLQRRITVGLVVVLIVAFAAISAATTLFLRSFLLDRLDSQLSAAGDRFAVSLEHGQFAPGGDDGDADNRTGAANTGRDDDGDADDSAPGQSVGTLGARLVDGRLSGAAVVERDGDDRRLRLSPGDAGVLRSVPVDGTPRTVHFSSLGDYRIEAVRGRDGDVQLTGLPMHDVDETLARLVTVEVAVSAVVIVLSGLVATLGVGRTLRPLRQVAATALHVSDLPLTEAATPLPARIAPTDPTSEADRVSVAFDHMLDHVRAALTARDHTEATLRQFVADASHELRTPLATIKAYSEYAVRSGVDLPEQTASSLARIEDAATRMGAMVDDLLLLARLDAGRPLAEDVVDLSQLVLDTVDDARTAGPGRHWVLDLPEQPVLVTGDGQRLHQVLSNLAANASVHTPPGTTVTTVLSVDDETVLVRVSDDGPGIAAELQPEVFARFVRGDAARSARAGSSGLGLAIAHGIVAAHGGRLALASRPGATTFTVALPRHRPPDAAAPAPSTPTPTSPTQTPPTAR